MGSEKDDHRGHEILGFPGYEILLIGIGFLVGILACTVMSWR